MATRPDVEPPAGKLSPAQLACQSTGELFYDEIRYWRMFKSGQNTAEIAFELNEKECDVYNALATAQELHYQGKI
jgi:hypothetical protein